MGGDTDKNVNCYYISVYVVFATVAQLAEQRFCKPQVNGSSPFGGYLASAYRRRSYLRKDHQPTLRFRLILGSGVNLASLLLGDVPFVMASKMR